MSTKKREREEIEKERFNTYRQIFSNGLTRAAVASFQSNNRFRDEGSIRGSCTSHFVC